MQFQDQAYSDALSQLKYEENSAFLFASTQSELNEGDKDHEHLYAWASETKMTQFDPSAMCQALTGNVLFVGDVIGEQHYTALKIELAHTNTQFDSKPMPDTEWYPSHLEPDDAIPAPSASMICNQTRMIAFIRNDWLDLETSTSKLGPVVFNQPVRECDVRALPYVERGMCAPWADRDLLKQFQLVVLSTGARFRSNGLFCAGLTKTLRWLNRNMETSTRVLYRTEVPATAGDYRLACV